MNITLHDAISSLPGASGPAVIRPVLAGERDSQRLLALCNAQILEQTVDDEIYQRLSERMKNRYDVFGSMPDTLKAEWIEDIETPGDPIDARREATGVDLRYNCTMTPPGKDSRDCSRVLSRRDSATLMHTVRG